MINVFENSYTYFRYKHLSIKFFLGSCLVVFVFNSAHAAVWLIDPKMTLSYEYNDNYLLVADSSAEDEVSTTKLTGELALKGKSERLDVKALLRIDTLNYAGDDSNLSERGNQLVGLSSRYKLSERNTISLNSKYFRDSILRTEGILFDDVITDPDTDIDVDLVNENVRRSRFSFKPGWRYFLNEKTALNLEYRFQDVSFSGEGGTGLIESERQTILGYLTRKISEIDTFSFSVASIYFRPDDPAGPDQDVDTIEAKIGWTHDFSEAFQMDFSAGVRDSDFDNAQKSSDSGFVGNIGATKYTDLTTYRVNLQRKINPSASGNQVEVDEVLVNINRAITEKLNFTVNGRYFDSESTGNSTSSANRDYISFEPGLNWRLLPSWVVGASYKYIEEDLDDGGSADSNSAFVSISYSPPRQF